MLAALGMFVFEAGSALFDQIERKRGWRHARTDRFGARAASQYLGPGDDQITLSGAIVPELGAQYSSLDRIVQMADTGEAYPFADGTGRILGTFTIDSLDQSGRYLTDNGVARWTDFTLTMTRVA